MAPRRILVFGPAYLDRVLLVDRPLVDPTLGPPIDQSHDGRGKFGDGPALVIADSAGYLLQIDPPTDWPGPRGEIRLDRPIHEGLSGRRVVRGLSWRDQLGGMGAGYAAAFGGRLTSALGAESDPTSREIARQLAELGVACDPIRKREHPADWTLLISSGAYGDKLPIGFRGCHAALEGEELDDLARQPCDLKVVASLANELAARVLAAPGARARFLAPAMRNMLDSEFPLAAFAKSIDVLSCNRLEWETLERREEVAWQVSILVVTDGSRGSLVRYTTTTGEPARLRLPAFPRDRPPRDTNRAGEAFAATLLGVLLKFDWDATTGVVDDDLMRTAASRAGAAAALELDMADFRFPSASEIDAALAAGGVA
jgi:ribokinase